jgi:hypothetical protein
MEHFLRFLCLEVLPVCLQREVKPFIIWFYPPWLDYDVSLHKFAELVVVIPTSPRSPKMESECSSYCGFCFDVSASFRVAGIFRGAEKASVFLRFGVPIGATVQYGGRIFVRKFGRKKPVRGQKSRSKAGKSRCKLPQWSYFWRGGGYKYPFFLLGLGMKWASLTSIVDFASLPSLLLSPHDSCIFFREK